MSATSILLVLGLFLVGTVFGYFFRKLVMRKRAETIESKLGEKIEQIKTEAAGIILDAKKKAVDILEDAKEELKQEKMEIRKLEERSLRKEEAAERLTQDANAKNKHLEEQIEKVKVIRQELSEASAREVARLEEVGKLSKDEAKAELTRRIEEHSKEDLAQIMHKMDAERKEQIEKKASEIISTVLQRYARSHVTELTTSTVPLPNEDLKGRIIGREGRNIRHLERLTGVEIIVDETPEAITISSFDPVRREIAKVALEKLIVDGRIQPARIEEKVEEAKREIQQRIKEAGENAVYEVGILDLPPDIVHLLGRLAFRTSYGQNVLTHSIEVSLLAGMLAKELGLNVEVAKKAGLLHDIGKAVDHEIEGTHLELGKKILQKYKISEPVVLAMQSHHEDYPIAIPEAYLINTADAISGARPGARRESMENYIKRLEELEKIATSFEGVEKSYAIQAGRELRVFVFPEKIDDYGAGNLARNIALKIEAEMRYPGEIKVNVIRETRAIEYAR